MQNKNNPLSPHLQIYKWQISSLLSITHRIVGVINILAITLICIWVLSLLLGESNYFESLNFRYFGPIDGHDVKHLSTVLKDLKNIPGPKILHCLTKSLE